MPEPGFFCQSPLAECLTYTYNEFMSVPSENIIMPPTEKAPLHTGNILSWMWYFCLPYKRPIILFTLYRFFRYTWFGFAPIAIGYAIDGFTSGEAQQDPQTYAFILFGYLAVFWAVLTCNFIFTHEIRVFEKAARAMTLYGIAHINNLPLRWHEKNDSGNKLQRVMTARRGFQELARHFRWELFPLIGQFCAIGFSFFFTDIPQSYLLLYFLFLVTYLGASWYFARPYLKMYDKFNETFENLLGGVYEFVSAIRTVKSFDLEDYVVARGKKLEEQGQYAVIRAYRQNLIRWSINNFIGGLWIIVFAASGFYMSYTGSMSAGTYAATFWLAYRLWTELEVIAAIQEKVYEHGNGVYRLVKTLLEQPKPVDREPLQDLPANWQNLTLKSLSFVYGKDVENGQGIKEIDLNVRRGEKIAFVGESGAGKSTLIKLLMKQMLPDQGAIMIDDIDLKHIPGSQWLGEIGFVPQDVELFNMSIRDNILIDRQDIDEETYKTALKQAALDDFVSHLPDGDETFIGERGIKLSGGQRQRLGIARALVRKSEIIIFDEATSSLDSLSEKKIQYAMENAFSGHTVFLIAHRLSTVRHVDRIIVLEKGRIIEQGSFDELIQKDGTFSNLWQIQSEALDHQRYA